MRLTEGAGMTFVHDDNQAVGMVQLDPYGSVLWTSWVPDFWTSGGWTFDGYHTSCVEALAKFGWIEQMEGIR